MLKNLSELPTKIFGLRISLPKEDRVRERFGEKPSEYQLRYKTEGRETTHHKVAVVTELLAVGKIREKHPWRNRLPGVSSP